MAKRFVAIALAAVMCLSFVGCSNDGAPDGMFSATCEGEPFILYVPDGWTENTSSGISGAYYSATERIAVSARYYTPDDAELTLDGYVQARIAEYAASSEKFDLLENNAAVLGGVDAKELIYTLEYESEKFTFRQLVAKYLGDFVVLTFYAPTDSFENNTEMFDMIVEEFVLCEKGETVNDCVTDKKTPEGMKIASSDNLEYRLYVPQSWVCDSQSGRSEAYYPESGTPNVTVTSYSPSQKMTAEEYFEECEEQYKENIEGYSLISTADRTVGGRDAKIYTYSAAVGNVNMRIMQVIFVYSDLVYSVTYTALTDSFDAHLADVETILDAFTFR